MKRTKQWIKLAALVALASTSIITRVGIGSAVAADSWGLTEGAPEIKAANRLAFGPEGVLFIGDAQSATVFAVQTGDKPGAPEKSAPMVEGLSAKLAALYKADAKEIQINDLAVNPVSGRVFVALSVGAGGSAKPALAKIDEKGNVEPIALGKIAFAKVALPNAPEDKEVQVGNRKKNPRAESITDLVFINGKLLVAGLSSSKSPSTVRELAFPFVTADEGTNLEIYHGAHGKLEDYAPVRTLIPVSIGGKPSILAGFTCTPLVRIPLDSLEKGKKVRGTTVAELGNYNQPLDMIVYERDGNRYLLLSNSARGVMKVDLAGIEKTEPITAKVSTETAGQKFTTVDALKGVVQMDRLNDKQAVVVVQTTAGDTLKTVDLP